MENKVDRPIGLTELSVYTKCFSLMSVGPMFFAINMSNLRLFVPVFCLSIYKQLECLFVKIRDLQNTLLTTEEFFLSIVLFSYVKGLALPWSWF